MRPTCPVATPKLSQKLSHKFKNAADVLRRVLTHRAPSTACRPSMMILEGSSQNPYLLRPPPSTRPHGETEFRVAFQDRATLVAQGIGNETSPAVVDTRQHPAAPRDTPRCPQPCDRERPDTVLTGTPRPGGL